MRVAVKEPRSRCPLSSIWLRSVLLTSLVALGLPTVLTAQTESAEHEGAEEEHHAEHHHKNHIALFVGSTEAEKHHGEQGDPDFTLGLDYERRLSPRWGFGGLLDVVVEGRREFLVGPMGFLHVFEGGKLFAAPCYQKIREGSEDEFVFRIGAAWDFEVGRYSIAPNVMYDFADEQDFLVLGVTFGAGF